MSDPERFKKPFSLPTLIFVGLGLVLVSSGLTMGWLARSQTHGLPSVEGTVVSHVSLASGKDHCIAPVVIYKVKHQSYQLTPSSAWSCQFFPPSVGDTILVFYPDSDPSDGRIPNFALHWFVPGLFLGIGTVLGLVGGVISKQSS